MLSFANAIRLPCAASQSPQQRTAPVNNSALQFRPSQITHLKSLRVTRQNPPRSLHVKVQAASSVAASSAGSLPDENPALTDLARLNLKKAATSCRRYGWFGFWSQLVLSVVSTVILLFSAAFTQQNSPAVSVYLTLFGVVLGFISTFWAWSYTRLSRKLFSYLSSPTLEGTKQVKRSEVTSMLERGIVINILGMGSTLLGLSANVGTLVAKTLTTATANPFIAGQQTGWNPVLALDVFNVQACANTLLAHFISIVCSLLVLKVVTDKRAPRQL